MKILNFSASPNPQKIDAPQSKPILEEIDTALAGHYAFTADELHFILNYDIKYRLGRDIEGEEED